MKKNIIICIVAVAAFIAGLKVGQPNDLQEVKAYHAYYKATEEFLDTLDNHYGWADAFDPQDYIATKNKLDNLLKEEK